MKKIHGAEESKEAKELEIKHFYKSLKNAKITLDQYYSLEYEYSRTKWDTKYYLLNKVETDRQPTKSNYTALTDNQKRVNKLMKEMR